MKPEVERRVAAELRKGAGIHKVAKKLGVRHGESRVHSAYVAASEATRQAAVAAAGNNQAAMRSAGIAHYRTYLASAKASGVSPKQYIEALRELGTGGA